MGTLCVDMLRLFVTHIWNCQLNMAQGKTSTTHLNIAFMKRTAGRTTSDVASSGPSWAMATTCDMRGHAWGMQQAGRACTPFPRSHGGAGSGCLPDASTQSEASLKAPGCHCSMNKDTDVVVQCSASPTVCCWLSQVFTTWLFDALCCLAWGNVPH